MTSHHNERVIRKVEGIIDEVIEERNIGRSTRVLRGVAPFLETLCDMVDTKLKLRTFAPLHSRPIYNLPTIEVFAPFPPVPLTYREVTYNFKGLGLMTKVAEFDPGYMDFHLAIRSVGNRGAKDWNLYHPHTNTRGSCCFARCFAQDKLWEKGRFSTIIAYYLNQVGKYDTADPYMRLPYSENCQICGMSFRKRGNTYPYGQHCNCKACGTSVCGSCYRDGMARREFARCYICSARAICPNCRSQIGNKTFCRDACKSRYISHRAFLLLKRYSMKLKKESRKESREKSRHQSSVSYTISFTDSTDHDRINWGEIRWR